MPVTVEPVTLHESTPDHPPPDHPLPSHLPPSAPTPLPPDVPATGLLLVTISIHRPTAKVLVKSDYIQWFVEKECPILKEFNTICPQTPVQQRKSTRAWKISKKLQPTPCKKTPAKPPATPPASSAWHTNMVRTVAKLDSSICEIKDEVRAVLQVSLATENNKMRVELEDIKSLVMSQVPNIVGELKQAIADSEIRILNRIKLVEQSVKSVEQSVEHSVEVNTQSMCAIFMEVVNAVKGVVQSSTAKLTTEVQKINDIVSAISAPKPQPGKKTSVCNLNNEKDIDAWLENPSKYLYWAK